MRTAGVLLGGTLSVVLVVSACSDGRPDSSSGGGASPSLGGAETAGDGGIDAASITPRPDLCEGLALGGDRIEELLYASDPIPPLGGELQQGTFDLVTADAFGGKASKDASSEVTSQSSGRIVQSTIVVGEFSFQVLTATGTGDVDLDAGVGAPAASAYLYRTFDANLFGTLVCPSTALPVTFGYTAAPNGLVFYPDATHRWLYQRRDG